MTEPQDQPARAGAVLATLIIVAGVANLNLSVANVALPSIGRAFDASQTALNMIAVGFSLGLAASVVYLGALGDRYGRKMILLIGMGLSIPAALLAAFAWSEQILALARIFGGVCAGMAYPTTLALITALWPEGPKRTKAIARWSAIGGGIMVLGPLTAGWLLEHFWWGSVFLITAPLAVVAFTLAFIIVPAHVNESTEPVDNLGGVLSVIMIATLVLAINFAPVPGAWQVAIGLAVVAAIAAVLFIRRQRRAPNPLYDLTYAKRRTFWAAAVAGIVCFGTLMGTMYIGQQFLQNVLGYNTLASGFAILPSSIAMILVAGLSAKMVNNLGSRNTLLAGFASIALGFVVMLVFWKVSTPVIWVIIAYAFVGLGVGLAGTPASNSLTASVPPKRAGMASGTADLQRDLGGAIMQSILGALLSVGYAFSVAKIVAKSPDASQVTDSILAQFQKSFAGALELSDQYPQYATEIVAAAKKAFLDGANLAYAAGILAVVIGALITYFFYPAKDKERELLESYAKQDKAPTGAS